MSSRQSRTIIIGVGNPYRSDDGAGIVVVRQLLGRVPVGVSIVEESGEGAALMEAWKDAAAAVVVDAVHSDAPPGTIHRLDACSQQIPEGFFHYSTHAFSVAEAIELARTLNQLPPHLIVYGIEGKNFSAGTELSAVVEQAVPTLVSRVLEELSDFKDEGSQRGAPLT
jgi:hydrogenase maturation protease